MKRPKRPTDREIIRAVQVLADYGHYFRVVHGPKIAKRLHPETLAFIDGS